MISSKYRKRLAVLVVIILLLLGGVLGVTIAYFQDYTDIVKNTFVGGILFNQPETDFKLVEREIEEIPRDDAAYGTAKYRLTDREVTVGQSYTVVPGVKIPKRPYIKINKLLMDAYLFVSVEIDQNKFNYNDSKTVWTTKDNMIYWTMAPGWTFLKFSKDGTKAIYHYTGSGTKNGALSGGTTNPCIDIMKQDNGYSIVVDKAYQGRADGFPTLEFKAYICQTSGDSGALTATQAWNINFGS